MKYGTYARLKVFPPSHVRMQVEVPALTPEEISSTTAGESSALIRERVEAARRIHRERFRRASIQSNAEMPTRGYDRLLKVARTIADLAACERLNSAHVAEAVH